MKTNLAKWSLIFLCFSTAGAIGGGFDEHIVLFGWEGVRISNSLRLRAMSNSEVGPASDPHPESQS
ncbi:MAG: hypothetical protein ACREBG_12970 [Pyrinomonadaceae bacterium]